MIRLLKNLIRFLLLRGPLLDWWVSRRARQWENAYRHELIKGRPDAVPQPIMPAPARTGSLRSILFISDCMWEQNDLVPELTKLAEVTVLDLGPKLRAKSLAETSAQVVAATIGGFAASHRGLAPDVILFYARPALLSEEAFDALRRRWACPLLGMNLDDKFEFFPYGIFSGGVDDYQSWARRFDLNLTNCQPATEWYRQRGLACLYCPPGFHPHDNDAPPTSSNFKYKIGFLGSRKPERKVIIEKLKASGVPIELWGNGWPNARWVDDPRAIFRQTQINLGIGLASPSLVLTTVKARDFECPGAGACYLTTYNWELAHLYELGKEILCYRSMEELIEIYCYYYKRPKECLQVAQAAWHRCHQEHTWEKRFRKAFMEMGYKLQR